MEQVQRAAVVFVTIVCATSSIEGRSFVVPANNISVPNQINPPLQIHQELKLSKFVNICCGVSLSLMSVTIFVYLLLGLYRDANSIIRLNFISTLVLLQVIFMFGVTRTESAAICAATTMTLHWIGLAAFSWMLIEGFHIYSQVTNDYGLESFRKSLYISIGYVPPLVIVCISVAINFQDYITPYRRCCWLTARGYVYWSFIVPILIILLVNLTLVAMVLRMLINPNYIDATWRKRAADIKLTGRGLMLLGPAMELCWLFSLLAVNEDSFVFQCTFAVLNVSQGAIVFTYQCLLDRKVHHAVSDWCIRHSLGDLFTREERSTKNVESGDSLSVRRKHSTCSIEENEAALSTGNISLEPEQRRVSTQEFSNDAFVTEEDHT